MDNKVHPHKRFHGENWHTPQGRIIREVVFGINDGLVSTIGFIAGVYGSIADARLIALAGIAEIIAGAFSMGMSSYISTKSQRDYFLSEIEREKWEIEKYPEKEHAELREILEDKGFMDGEIDVIADRLTSNEDMLLDFMLTEELGISDEDIQNPVVNGLVMSVSFIVGALSPVIPFLLIERAGYAMIVALFASIAAAFIIGAARKIVTKKSLVSSGMEFLVIGVIAAAAGYLCGLLVARILPG